MRKEKSTQFGITVTAKDKLDRYRAQHKEQILRYLKKTRQQVTNAEVIEYLVYVAER